MDDLQSIQEEIGERLCTLPRGKLIELSQFLEIQLEANVTRLSLVSRLSNHLLRSELEELEDGGMAELLSINDKLSEIMLTDVNVSEPSPELVQVKERENVVQRQPGEIKHTTDLLPAVQTHPTVSQSMRLRPASADSVAVNSSLPPQGQMIPTVWHREFKISGFIGEPGQRDRLTFSSLARQIESGLNKGYPENEIVDSVIRAITPGLQLRSYLEGKTDLTLPMLRRILRSHYQEKNATELYKQLTAESQRAKETPQSFLIRVLDLRQKILFASQEDESGLKYDPALVQNMFLHTVLTGLQNDRIQSDLQPYLTDTTVTDETLLEKLNVACSHEAERQSKRKSERSATVNVTQLNDPTLHLKSKQKQPKSDLMSQLKSLSEEVKQIKESMQQPSPLPQQCCTVNNDVSTLRTVHQSISEENQVPQSQAWRQSQNGGEQQQQYPFQASHFTPQPYQRQMSPMPVQYFQPTRSSQYAAQGFNPQQFHAESQSYVATPQSQYFQPYRQSRLSRPRQCFHCQQARSMELCTHCYRCGSNEHFLAGCKERGNRTQRRVQLNEDGLPPRDRE